MNKINELINKLNDLYPDSFPHIEQKTKKVSYTQGLEESISIWIDISHYWKFNDLMEAEEFVDLLVNQSRREKVVVDQE